MVGGVDGYVSKVGQHFAGERVQLNDALHLVAEELNSYRRLFVGRDDFQGIAADAKLSTGQVHVVALVMHVHQLAHQLAPIPNLPNLYLGN